MKYFNPSYWFKLWVLSIPLFNDKTQGINAKSIDNNQKIKDWTSNNTNLELINQEINYTNSSTNYQPYNLNEINQNINPFYQLYLDSFSNQQSETSTHKHRHEKSRNKQKRSLNNNVIDIKIAPTGSIYFITSTGKVYFMNNYSRSVVQINTLSDYFVKDIGMVEKNIDSNNLRAGSVFFITDKGVYLVPQQNHDWTLTKINGLDNNVINIKIAPTGSIYFITSSGKVYFMNNYSRSVVQINTLSDYFVKDIGMVEKNIDSNNLRAGSVFFITDKGVYLVPQQNHDWTLTKINGLDNNVIDIKLDLGTVIYKINLGSIFNYDDKTILNILNYLNPNLDIGHLEISIKDDISATIKAKNNSNKYTGSKKIYYSINENKIINLNELIKQALFLNFRDKNSFQGDIKSLNLENLFYSNIELIKNSEIEKINFLENICSGSIEFPILSHEQTYHSPSCEYSQEITRKYEIIKGLTNTIGIQNSKEETNTWTSGNSKTEIQNWNWNINPSFTIFGFGGSIGGGGKGGETSSTNENSISNTTSYSNTLSIGKSFDLSNTNTHELKVITELTFPSQPIKILANEQIKVSIVVNKTANKIFLTLKQKIYGEINGVISSKNIADITLNVSIKELMQTLQRNNLLPPEIFINDNDSITFNGKILLTETKNNLDSKLNRDIINTPQIVKKDVEKWNITFAKTINQKQYLPPITNNSNYVANNITFL
ncbi:ETX/MTX2 family pore-forming toxin [Spiroplasma endosymbiont of Polydrusus pterygomalis]|uniref:ETX/MTX2 family pore-forming toxin n=1 Tax=Spiroplasma endosymbiont of Polydrusus pterygomalis TaxID=3139327 RepID=UPI003CCAC0F6